MNGLSPISPAFLGRVLSRDPHRANNVLRLTYAYLTPPPTAKQAPAIIGWGFAFHGLSRLAQSIPSAAQEHVPVIVHPMQRVLHVAVRQAQLPRNHIGVGRRDNTEIRQDCR